MHDDNNNVTNKLFDWLNEESNGAARAARFLMQFFDLPIFWLANDNVKIFIFEVLATTEARSNKSFILWLCMITIGAKQVKVHLASFVDNVTNVE